MSVAMAWCLTASIVSFPLAWLFQATYEPHASFSGVNLVMGVLGALFICIAIGGGCGFAIAAIWSVVQ